MAARFRIRGRLPDGRSRVVADWQPNLILDAGLERYAAGAPFSYCVLGSGTATPAAGQTALGTFLVGAAVTTSANGVRSGAPYYGWRTMETAFAPPGTNRVISEVGWGWADDGGSLWSRALIKDGDGDPQSFQWLADESLTIDYEVRNYPWTSDATDTTTISGTEHTCTIRAARVNQAAHWQVRNQPYVLWANTGNTSTLPKVHDSTIGAITSVPGGTSADASSTTVDAYVAASHERTGSATWNAGAANFTGGIDALQCNCGNGCWQIGFSPAIAKTVAQILVLNVASPTWGRQA